MGKAPSAEEFDGIMFGCVGVSENGQGPQFHGEYDDYPVDLATPCPSFDTQTTIENIKTPSNVHCSCRFCVKMHQVLLGAITSS